MLEMVEFVLLGGEVKRTSPGVPKNVSVDVNVDRITPKTPDSVLLEFTYAVDYAPAVGMVRITGQAICRDTPDNIRKMLAEYKKKKSLPNEYGSSVINMINASAGLNSIFLIRPFNLLPPFMPPLINAEKTGPEKQSASKK
jgi:hypothetical protein